MQEGGRAGGQCRSTRRGTARAGIAQRREGAREQFLAEGVVREGR